MSIFYEIEFAKYILPYLLLNILLKKMTPEDAAPGVFVLHIHF